MTNYINLNSKKLVGRNNNPCTLKLTIDYDTLFDLSFSFINEKNQIVELEDTVGLYLALGLIGVNGTFGQTIMLSDTYTVSGNLVTFRCNTYTKQFLEGVTKKYQTVNIELGRVNDNGKEVLLRDTCDAAPRVWQPGKEPEDIQGDYYTKVELNGIINNLSSFVINECADTRELITQTPIEILSGSSGVAEPGKVYSLDMAQDFTLSATTLDSSTYGEAVLFVKPNEFAFSVADDITLDAEMSNLSTCRLLVSWTPVGTLCEQTGAWTD